MTETAVTISSAGLRLAGMLRVPGGLAGSERRAAFLVLHGFGSNRSSSNVLQPSKVLGALGYVTHAFDIEQTDDWPNKNGQTKSPARESGPGFSHSFLRLATHSRLSTSVGEAVGPFT